MHTKQKIDLEALYSWKEDFEMMTKQMPKNKWDTINNVFPTDLFGKKLEKF
ncbi:hypothetical protein FUSO6_07410 [Fusobacterium necrophorum DAB]|uniref:Uncharacterized protein n=2 Tax=Fusobacterium necrophorum TaxID=859 RepID=A0A0B4EJS8_9FUSO|nr:hypothetical protein [Fusobacterium necrophorum]KDE63552.1 hypothetical protein FUSO3_05020 [Fusobacterium necrophorum BL]KDE68972.1 hypothetical protein FUSO6_07410 [Fusobacterium necrophorum DAB]KDE71790.1 hypothetical protein FUSO7_09540 [Fusobacterium necrophorum BFTR-2]KID49676.1 hypothetical protein C095_02565 [Fusobacterium necrophorum subsp. funduliforme B35]SDB36023.1 hypothetical protein SAMN02983009_01724 [Fusobacterium necrophorum]